ncbi:hypothetical protein PSTG_00159 [Puccinia striiformis f. sp. tritici PST-78]|uniref:Uncharacterized protein n=1 Tax=Puccinia striiformis f. sp. tritici PST-78 TaxID=1165861 RepID=A0A0L0W5T8_9BASI|nr:hypothetical protein PSTG_00159 [Puccinia striiformis f. sp. tritici PST-78]
MARASTKSINPQANQANSTDNPLSGYKGSYGIAIGRSCDQLNFGQGISMGVGFINGRMRGAEYTNSQHATPTPHGTNTLDFQAAFGLVPKQGSFGDSEWDQEHPHHHIKSDPQKGWAALIMGMNLSLNLSRKVGTVNPLSNALITVVPPSKHSFYETSSHQRKPSKTSSKSLLSPTKLVLRFKVSPPSYPTTTVTDTLLIQPPSPPATGGSYWIPILDLEEDQSVLNKRRMNHAAEDLHQARVSLIDRNDQLLMNKESLGSFHNPRSILHCISALNHHPTNSHNTLTSQIYQEREQLVTLLLFNQKLNMKFA